MVASTAAVPAVVHGARHSTGGADPITVTPAAVTGFNEAVHDAVAALLAAGTQTGISVVYNDAANSLSLTITGVANGAAPIESPVFTGDPLTPTPDVGDNDLSIANTAYVTKVQAAIDARLATLEAAVGTGNTGGGGGTTPPAAGTVLFNGDLSGGNTAQWSLEKNASASVTVYNAASRPNGGSAQPALAPLPPPGQTYAAKFYTYGADTDGANVRSQLRAASTPFKAGNDVYFHGWTYFPAGFPTIDSGVTAGEYFMFFETFGDPYNGSPNGGLYVSADNHGGVNHLVCRNGTGVEAWYGPALTTGRWYHFIVRKFFKQDSTGFLEIWLDGVQQTMTNSTTRWPIATQTAGEISSYLIINNYFQRNAHSNITIYHAGWRAASSLDLALASYSTTTPSAPTLITGNKLSLNQQDVETDLTGFTAGANTTISRVTGGRTGTYALKATATAAGNIEVTLDFANVTAATAYVASIWAKPDVGTPALSGQFFANAHDSAGNYVRSLTGPAITTTSAWTQATWNITTVNTAGVGKVQLDIQLYGASAGQAFLFDTLSLV